jgi:hypothetical protein
MTLRTDDSLTRGEEFAIYRDTDETLTADDRDLLSPSELVERKLIGLLKESPLLVSQVQRRLRPSPR